MGDDKLPSTGYIYIHWMPTFAPIVLSVKKIIISRFVWKFQIMKGMQIALLVQELRQFDKWVDFFPIGGVSAMRVCDQQGYPV